MVYLLFGNRLFNCVYFLKNFFYFLLVLSVAIVVLFNVSLSRRHPWGRVIRWSSFTLLFRTVNFRSHLMAIFLDDWWFKHNILLIAALGFFFVENVKDIFFAAFHTFVVQTVPLLVRIKRSLKLLSLWRSPALLIPNVAAFCQSLLQNVDDFIDFEAIRFKWGDVRVHLLEIHHSMLLKIFHHDVLHLIVELVEVVSRHV